MNSLVSYLEKANTGVRGRVVDQEGKPVKEANILVKRDDNPWRDSWLTTNKYVTYPTPGRPKYSPTPLLKTENNTKMFLPCSPVKPSNLFSEILSLNDFSKKFEQNLSVVAMSGNSERTLP